MARIQISNDPSGRIIVSFPYEPLLVSKVKTIDGRRWHPVEKHWSFPDTDGIFEKILGVFEGEEVQINPSLKQRFSVKSKTAQPFSEHNFEDLRRELVSRKYSYKTVKGYIYYNGAIRNELAKMPIKGTSLTRQPLGVMATQ